MNKYYTLAIVHRDPFTMPHSANAVEPVRFSGKRNAVGTAAKAVAFMLRKQADRHHGTVQMFQPSERDADHWSLSGIVCGKQGEVLYSVDAEVTGSEPCGREIPPTDLLKDTFFMDL